MRKKARSAFSKIKCYFWTVDNHLYGLNRMSECSREVFSEKKCALVFVKNAKEQRKNESNWGNLSHICKLAIFSKFP